MRPKKSTCRRPAAGPASRPVARRSRSDRSRREWSSERGTRGNRPWREEWITAAKVGEMCRRAPRRSLLLSSVAQRGAAPPSARHSHGARGPQRRRAILCRALTDRPPPSPGLQWYTVHHTGFSFSDNRGESRNRVADKRCATCCARNSRAASHSPAGSVSQAGKWRKRREAARSRTHPGSPRGYRALLPGPDSSVSISITVESWRKAAYVGLHPMRNQNRSEGEQTTLPLKHTIGVTADWSSARVSETRQIKKWNIQGQYNFQVISRAADNQNFVTRLRNLSVSLSTSARRRRCARRDSRGHAFNNHYKTFSMSNFLSKVYSS